MRWFSLLIPGMLKLKLKWRGSERSVLVQLQIYALGLLSNPSLVRFRSWGIRVTRVRGSSRRRPRRSILISRGEWRSSRGNRRPFFTKTGCVSLRFNSDLTDFSPIFLHVSVVPQGNAYFKEGKYDAAVECYTKGMEADDMNVLLPANRAMAFLKLEKYGLVSVCLKVLVLC